MHVQVPVISNRECLDKYSRIGVVQSTIQFGTGVICAGHTYGGADSCQGDSGKRKIIENKNERTIYLCTRGLNDIQYDIYF